MTAKAECLRTMAEDDLMDSYNRFGIKQFVKILGGTDGAQTKRAASHG